MRSTPYMQIEYGIFDDDSECEERECPHCEQSMVLAEIDEDGEVLDWVGGVTCWECRVIGCPTCVTAPGNDPGHPICAKCKQESLACQ